MSLTREWTIEELDNLKRMAAAAFTVSEMAEVMELELAEFERMILEVDMLRKAIRSGYLQRQLELRERIFKDARNGSSPAQAQALKMMNDVHAKNPSWL